MIGSFRQVLVVNRGTRSKSFIAGAPPHLARLARRVLRNNQNASLVRAVVLHRYPVLSTNGPLRWVATRGNEKDIADRLSKRKKADQPNPPPTTQITLSQPDHYETEFLKNRVALVSRAFCRVHSRRAFTEKRLSKKFRRLRFKELDADDLNYFL